MTSPCAWCSRPVERNPIGRPRRYCGEPCRRAGASYTATLPNLTARLAELEAAAAVWKRAGGTVPVAVTSELAAVRQAIGALRTAPMPT